MGGWDRLGVVRRGKDRGFRAEVLKMRAILGALTDPGIRSARKAFGVSAVDGTKDRGAFP